MIEYKRTYRPKGWVASLGRVDSGICRTKAEAERKVLEHAAAALDRDYHGVRLLVSKDRSEAKVIADTPNGVVEHFFAVRTGAPSVPGCSAHHALDRTVEDAARWARYHFAQLDGDRGWVEGDAVLESMYDDNVRFQRRYAELKAQGYDDATCHAAATGDPSLRGRGLGHLIEAAS